MCVTCACECRCPGTRGSGSLEAGVTAGGEPPHVGAGNAARVVCRRNYHWPQSNLPRPSAAFQLTFHFLDTFHITAVLYFLRWTEIFKKRYFFIRQCFISRVMYNRSSLWERITHSHSCLAIFSGQFVKMLYFNVPALRLWYSNARTKYLGDTHRWLWITHCFSFYQALLSSVEDNWIGSFTGYW